MIGILLGILKIILYIFLGIVGFFIICLFLVLFVPVSYKIIGNKYEKLYSNINVSWLFGFISFNISYTDDEIDYNIKILFFRIIKKKKQDEKVEENSKNEEIEKHYDGISMDDQANIIKELEDDIVIDKERKKEKINNSIRVKKRKEKTKRKDKEKRKDKDGIIYKIREILSDENKKTIKYIFSQLKKMFKSILPKKIDINITIGTGDPAITGCIIGVINIFYVYINEKVIVRPNFKEKEFNGQFFIKGHIYAVVFAYYGIKLILNKNVRNLVKKYS